MKDGRRSLYRDHTRALLTASLNYPCLVGVPDVDGSSYDRVIPVVSPDDMWLYDSFSKTFLVDTASDGFHRLTNPTRSTQLCCISIGPKGRTQECI